MKNENKTVTIDARHDFTDAEMSQHGIHAARSHREYQRAEEEMKSSQKDWKAKLDRIALDRDGVLRKLGDGFEMRPIQAIVVMNHPSPGSKSYWTLSQYDQRECGNFIREEPMDATDYQRELPLEEMERQSGFCPHGKLWDANCDECNAESEQEEKAWKEKTKPVDPERFPEAGESAKEVSEARRIIEESAQPIGTSIGDLLDQAAQGKRPNPVVIDFGTKDDGNKCLAKWRKAARNQGWPEPCIDLIDGLAKDAAGDHSTDGDGSTKSRMLSVLHAHSISTAGQAEKETIPQREDWRGDDGETSDHERLASTFGTSEDE